MKLTISATQLNTFNTCGMRYYFRYIKNIIIPPSGVVTRGRSVHEAIKYNYTNKLSTGQDEPIQNILDSFSSAYDEYIKETQLQPEENVSHLKDTGISMTEKYHLDIAPVVNPLLVEFAPPKLEISEIVDLYGIIDLVDKEKILRDTKTSSKKPNIDRATESLQLTGYNLLYPDIRNLQLDYVYGNKKENIDTVSFLIPSKTQEQLDIYKEMVHNVGKQIQTGIFNPNTVGWQCSEKYCGYAKICKYYRMK